MIGEVEWAGAETGCDDANGSGTADACEAALPGDINGDGFVNLADFSPFVDVLIGQPQAAEHVARCDLTGDGTADGRDITIFVEILLAT